MFFLVVLNFLNTRIVKCKINKHKIPIFKIGGRKADVLKKGHKKPATFLRKAGPKYCNSRNGNTILPVKIITEKIQREIYLIFSDSIFFFKQIMPTAPNKISGKAEKT